jgi:EAL domain-containing protein (putative c-di-GMP-specific phosphodiesterase class I)
MKEQEPYKKKIPVLDTSFRLEPVVDVVSNEIFGFELLAGADKCPKWTDDDWETWYELIADLFRKYIPSSVQVFVNVDAHQALNPTIIKGLLDIPNRNRLVIEWTEHICSASHDANFYEAATRIFIQLAQAGFKLAIDDVGSGYDGIGRSLLVRPAFAKLNMSLTHLARCVDPSFLQGLNTFFKSIGIAVIAEGIESPDDIERIRSAGIRYVQGYYFMRFAQHYP